MLGAMLGGHSTTVATPESQFKEHLWQFATSDGKELDGAAAAGFVADHWRHRLWEAPIDVAAASQCKDVADLLRHVVATYAEKQGKPSDARWIDHTPDNLSYAGKLLQAFPDARFIHLVRDGRAVAASIMPLDWGPNDAVSAARYWMQWLAPGLAAELVYGPERVMRVRYEDILADPRGQLDRMAAFIGLDVEPAMLAGGGFKLPKFTQKQHALVDQPPDVTRAEAWRSKLTAAEVAQFEGIVREVLPMLGYTLATEALPQSIPLASRAAVRLRSAARKGRNIAAWAVRRWRYIPGSSRK